MKAPISGAKLIVPKKMFVKFAASICCMLKRFTRYTVRFAVNPIDATFSNASFPAVEEKQTYARALHNIDLTPNKKNLQDLLINLNCLHNLFFIFYNFFCISFPFYFFLFFKRKGLAAVGVPAKINKK